jgi:hypothetical protein
MADPKQSKTKSAPAPSILSFDELGWIGHALPAALGVASLIAAFFAYQSHIQITLTVALVVIGVLLPWVTWLSLHGNRAGWSFLVALSIVLGVMMLFGAPKVRTLTGMHIGLALLIPAAFAFAAVALLAQSHRYKN